MRLNKLTCGILLAMSAVPLYSSAATLSANDQTNTISGLDTSMMVSKDNGQHWATYSGEKDNNFPGTITVVVGTQDADAIKAVDYDPNAIYATGNTLVRYDGFYWTNAWYANPGEAPGSNEVWKKGAAISVKTLGTFSFHAFTGQAATDFQKQLKDKVAAQRKIIGYFPEWGVYDAHNNFTTDKIDFSQITHLNYGFTVVRNGVVNVFDSEQGPKLMPDLAKRTAAAGVTNMISVGGYTNSEEGVFEAATKDAAGVEKLSQSIVDYMVKWGFGGVDIDWEYPDTAAEKAQFTSLIQSLRGKLDTLGKQNDAYYQLSAAVVANYKKIEFMNPAVTTPLLDSVNLMAYDFHGAFDPITGHNAGLFANKADPQDQKFNTASVAEIYANTWSVPKSKIMVGIPFYGRAWGNVAATEKVKGLPGLFTAGSPTVHGQWDDSGQFSGTNPYSLLKTWASNPDYTRYWDSEAKVPYLYNSKTKEFFTYDDKESVQAKVDYINQNGFGGAIIWDLSGDTPDHELGEVVDDIIEKSAVTDSYISNLTVFGDVEGSKFMSFDVKKGFGVPYELRLNGQYVGSVNSDTSAPSLHLQDKSDHLFIHIGNNHLKAGDVVSVVRGGGADADAVVVSTLTVTEGMFVVPTAQDSYLSNAKVYVDGVGNKFISFDLKNGFSEYYQVNINGHKTGSVESTTSTPGMDHQVNTDSSLHLTKSNNNIKAGDVITITRGHDVAATIVSTIKVTADMLVVKDTSNTFYQDGGYGGYSVSITEDTSCLKDKYNEQGKPLNDVFSALKLGKDSLGVIMYNECGYGGVNMTQTASNNAFSKEMNDTVSSVKMIKAIGFKDNNFTGNSLIVDGDISDLKGVNFNDAMSSMKVAEGYTIRLFENANYQGQYIDLQSGARESDFSKLKFADVASSVKVIKN